MDAIELELQQLKQSGEAPLWLDLEGYRTLKGGYLLKDETPRMLYSRVAKAGAKYYEGLDYNGQSFEQQFFDIMWKNWLCLASPVASNMGTERGLPISCNTIHVDDSVDNIFTKQHELAMLSKNGAGVGVYLGDIRGRGTSINGNGKSEGIIPWAKCFDTTTVAVSQGATRRGATALYLPIEHADIEEFINIRRPVGDMNRRCLNVNNAICISDEWMNSMIEGDAHKRHLWKEIIKARVETGEPYLLFTDNVNNANPEAYKNNNLVVKSSNLCNEIMLYTDKDHTFVCCLSSMNLMRWEEWKDTNAVELSIMFLDAVLSEYIHKAKDKSGFEPAVRSASKGRAIGLGTLGWHSLLQARMLPFDSFEAMMLNSTIFRTIQQRSIKASKELAERFGEPEWCKGTGMRNTHLNAQAPTVSNSIISGGWSAGIEPIAANIFSQKTAKGTFIRKNKVLENILDKKDKNTSDTWKTITENNGSVQTLPFLTEHEKKVFLTAREINQFAIIKQAGQRQKLIDQGQSLNLFFGANSDPKYINQVHIEAWKAGLKGLYYLRTEGVLKGDLASRSKEECASCEA